jgi:hypothetical protein
MSNTNIFPEKVVRTRSTGDGGFFSEIYSLETWANLGILGFCIALFFLTAISPLISSLLALLFCLDIDSDDKPIQLNIIGIILSVYLLVDINKEWVMSFLYNFVFNPQEFQNVIHINCASIFTNVLLLIFPNLIYNLAFKNKFICFLYVAIILLITYNLAGGIF